jgi:hypothetical protein
MSEKEYRIVYPTEDLIQKGIEVDISKVGLEISEIICGYKCASEHMDRLDQIASLLNVPCRKCILSETEFTVYDEV